jgi:hypothetical protein
VLNEKERRRPEFVEGDWAELADGQLWCFPRPRIRFRPIIVDGKVEVGGGRTFGPEYDESLSILLGTKDAEPIDVLTVKFDMAIRLLRTNYTLSDNEVCDLISLDPDDEDSTERFRVVGRILAGIAPKPLADTSESPQ